MMESSLEVSQLTAFKSAPYIAFLLCWLVCAPKIGFIDDDDDDDDLFNVRSIHSSHETYL